LDALQAILGRRSIRKFTGESIPDKDVTKILEAAMAAPSACNQQPWHFIIIRDKETHEKIVEIHPNSRMLDKASIAILVCADLELQTCPGYWVQDVSAATENIMIAVHALGYGATWCGVYPIDERVWGIKELLNLPKNVIPLNVIAVGVPDEEKSPAHRYKIERVHQEKW
jgi:nitroreductase